MRALIVVDHGSRREEANAMLAEVGRLIAESDGSYHVEVAHMELAEPSLAAAFDACVRAGARDVTVCPYMLSPGRHSTEDIPALATEAARAHPGVTFRVAEALGIDRRLAEVVLSRAREVEARTRTIPSNSSPDTEEPSR